MGFEPGSDGNWEKVQNCLKTRQRYDLPGKIHAIWWGPSHPIYPMVAYSIGRFCVVTPRVGTRLLQTGDEKLLQLAKKCESNPFVA
jgi:hypothetical protein